MTDTPKDQADSDELRKKVLNALKRDWLAKLQANHPIDTVETLGPAASDFATDQLQEYEASVIADQQAADRKALLKGIDELHWPLREDAAHQSNRLIGYNEALYDVRNLINGKENV